MTKPRVRKIRDFREEAGLISRTIRYCAIAAGIPVYDCCGQWAVEAADVPLLVADCRHVAGRLRGRREGGMVPAMADFRPEGLAAMEVRVVAAREGIAAAGNGAGEVFVRAGDLPALREAAARYVARRERCVRRGIRLQHARSGE